MSNGIDFVIGGKNNAAPAMSSVEKSLTRLEAKTDSLAKSTKMLTTITGGLAAAYGTIKSAMALLGGLNAINAAYDTQIKAAKGLEVALKLQGAAFEEESERLRAFASDMQALTGVGDEATLGMMKQAAMMGVATADLDDMAKAAIGLGEAMGTSAESGMEMMRRAQEGNFMAFQKMFPAMKQMATDEERLAFVTELASKGLEAKVEASNRVAGMSERASGAVGDLMESVGALLAPVRILISAGIKTLAESLQTLLVPAVQYAEEVLANIGPLMDWVKSKVIDGVNLMIGAFTWLEVEFENLDKIWTLWASIAELAIVQTVEVIKHAFTEVIPGYAAWFAENFVNILRDGMNLAYTVITNGVTNIIDAFKALWDFIASGGTTDILGELGDIAGRSYLEGFEASLTDLPEIMGRTISDRERELTETIGQVGAHLGDEFNRKMSERMVKVGDSLNDELNREIDLKVNKSIGEATGTSSAGKAAGGAAQLNATESRLLSRGPAERTNELWERAVAALQQIMTSSNRTATATEAEAKKPVFAPEEIALVATI